MNVKKYLIASYNNPASVPWKIFNVFRRSFPIDYWFLKGWSFPPEMVTILVTKRCNFSCQGCSSSSPKYTKNFKGQELTTNEIKKFIDSVSFFKPAIYFCGGEPTLRSDLYELTAYAKKKGMVTAFTTNGSLLTESNINKILSSKLDFISVSLDGSAKHHNDYRGFKMAYEKLVSGLEKLIKERNRLGLNNPNVRITCIINPEDKKDALFVLKKAEELGVDEVAFGNLMFYPSLYQKKQNILIETKEIGGPHMIGFEVKGKKIPFKLDLKGLSGIYEEIQKTAKIPVSFVPKEIDYRKFYSFEDLSKQSRCLSPWFVATLMPDGALTSCQEYLLGSTKTNSFMSLWNSKKMRQFRIFKKENIFPACFRCLEGQEIKFD